MKRTCLVLATSCAVALSVSTARADGNSAAAEALFVEAKKLVAKGRFADACPKFAESNKLDRGAGTLIHLADCYEKNKQTATAWATYKEAASAAQALGRADWQKRAEKRATVLEPKLAHITIKVQAPVDKLEVKNDGAALSSASWDVPLPVDVGTHTIEASAPGFKPFKTSARIAKDGENVDVAIPKLEEEPKAEAVAATTATEDDPTQPPSTSAAPAAIETKGSPLKTVGYITAGAGVIGLAVGTVTGLMAISKNNDSTLICPDNGPCGSQNAVDASESAKSLGSISTIGFVAGGALVVLGAVFIVTAPKARTTGTRFVPHAGPSGGGLFLTGAF